METGESLKKSKVKARRVKRDEKGVGIKRLQQEGSEITRGENNWEKRRKGWEKQKEALGREVKEKRLNEGSDCKELWTLAQ